MRPGRNRSLKSSKGFVCSSNRVRHPLMQFVFNQRTNKEREQGRKRVVVVVMRDSKIFCFGKILRKNGRGPFRYTRPNPRPSDNCCARSDNSNFVLSPPSFPLCYFFHNFFLYFILFHSAAAPFLLFMRG